MTMRTSPRRWRQWMSWSQAAPMKPSFASSMAKTTLVSEATSCSYQRACSSAVTGRARSTSRATSGSFT